MVTEYLLKVKKHWKNIIFWNPQNKIIILLKMKKCTTAFLQIPITIRLKYNHGSSYAKKIQIIRTLICLKLLRQNLSDAKVIKKRNIVLMIKKIFLEKL